jgi:hypothetical protein
MYLSEFILKNFSKHKNKIKKIKVQNFFKILGQFPPFLFSKQAKQKLSKILSKKLSKIL